MHYQTPTMDMLVGMPSKFQLVKNSPFTIYHQTNSLLLIWRPTRFGDTTTSYINILFLVKIGFESLKYTTLLIELLETT